MTDVPAANPARTSNVPGVGLLTDLSPEERSAHDNLERSPEKYDHEGRVRLLSTYAQGVYRIGVVEGALAGVAGASALYLLSTALS